LRPVQCGGKRNKDNGKTLGHCRENCRMIKIISVKYYQKRGKWADREELKRMILA
jgi:hypothetical protein